MYKIQINLFILKYFFKLKNMLVIYTKIKNIYLIYNNAINNKKGFVRLLFL